MTNRDKISQLRKFRTKTGCGLYEAKTTLEKYNWNYLLAIAKYNKKRASDNVVKRSTCIANKFRFFVYKENKDGIWSVSRVRDKQRVRDKRLNYFFRGDNKITMDDQKNT